MQEQDRNLNKVVETAIDQRGRRRMANGLMGAGAVFVTIGPTIAIDAFVGALPTDGNQAVVEILKTGGISAGIIGAIALLIGYKYENRLNKRLNKDIDPYLRESLGINVASDTKPANVISLYDYRRKKARRKK